MIETVPTTDESLVQAAQAGDASAFEELVRRTTRLVYARIYLDLGDAHKTEDLVQETFLTAFKAVKQVTRPSGFRAWLLTIAQTVTLDHYRHEGRLRRSPPPREGEGAMAAAPGDGPAPAESMQKTESRDKVRAILQSLPESYRLPLTLRYIDGEDYQTISMQLGLTNGSLRGLLNRGLQLLRDQVKRTMGPELNGGRG